MEPEKHRIPGVALIISAYVMWAFFPLYFRQMEAVAPLDILAFRTLFALLSVLPLVFLLGKREEFFRQFRSLKNLGMLFLNAVLISLNWLIFIILVNTGHTIQASLGYYINPLITVFFAMLFFHERFGKLQWASIVIAAIGVAVFTFGVGSFPWGGFAAAMTFAFYGLMKKLCPTDPLTSLAMETLLLMPFVLGFLIVNDSTRAVWNIDPKLFLWLFGCGILTTTTLVLYGAAALRVKLSMIGLCQYITPSGQFLTAVFIFHEEMDPARWYCFALIWVALVLFTIDSLRNEESKSTYKGKR